MSFETTNGPKNAPEVISEGLKIKIFSGAVCPQTPLKGALPFAPQIFSKYYFAPPCPFFYMKHCPVKQRLLLHSYNSTVSYPAG